jgi:hypothetical protein
MFVPNSWTLEVAIPLLSLTFWFGAIIYCIPVRLYLDRKAMAAEQYTGKPNSNGKQDQ